MAKRNDTFVKVPLWWIEQATFPLPNGRLTKQGADRRAKRRALANLEAAGLITVERKDGKTPVVTLLCL